jgi:hypothetical protein
LTPLGLYREQFKTFEEYCGERWGIKERQAYRLMDGAKVTENLKSCPIGQLPATESQARPLAKLPADKQSEVWESVTEKAKREERKVTAKDVEMAVSESIDPMGSGKQPIANETYTSETMAGLKRYWKLANKKERKEFLSWIGGVK